MKDYQKPICSCYTQKIQSTGLNGSMKLSTVRFEDEGVQSVAHTNQL